MVKFLEDRDNNFANMEARSHAKLAVCQNLMVNVDGRGMWRRETTVHHETRNSTPQSPPTQTRRDAATADGEFTAGITTSKE